jgi:predicted GNAT superfamily acetyltransferase
MTLRIEPVTTIDDCFEVVALQNQTWPNFGAIPYHLLTVFAKHGGVVLLARDGSKSVGCVIGFIGRTPQGQPKHHSHMAMVLPSHQHQGIGYQLKLAQRERVLAQGIKLMTWTYDPLLARNAYFNLMKLGAVCNTFLRGVYDRPHAEDDPHHLPSDRFLVTWRLASPHVERRLAATAPPAPLAEAEAAPLLNPGGPAEALQPLSQPHHRFQIPTNFEAHTAQQPALALAWQSQLRHAFEAAFAEGYTVVDFIRGPDFSEYVLYRDFAG